MYNEEKRELRLQISQLLADAGLNQKTIKDIVEKEITNKVERAIEQVFKHLDSQTSSGSYIGEWVERYFKYSFSLKDEIRKQVKSELSDKIISVEFNETVKPAEKSNAIDLSKIGYYTVGTEYKSGDYVKYGDSYYTFGTLQTVRKNDDQLKYIREYIDDAKLRRHSAEVILSSIESILGDED